MNYIVLNPYTDTVFRATRHHPAYSNAESIRYQGRYCLRLCQSDLLHLLYPYPGRAGDQKTRRELEQGCQGCGGNAGHALYSAGSDVLCISAEVTVITWSWVTPIVADNVSSYVKLPRADRDGPNRTEGAQSSCCYTDYFRTFTDTFC